MVRWARAVLLACALSVAVRAGLRPLPRARPAPLCAPRAACTASAPGTRLYYRLGNVTLVVSYWGKYLSLTCTPGIDLDHPALPAFPRLTSVPLVALLDCAPPVRSYAHVLRALNVTCVALELLVSAAPRTSLQAHHLVGLEDLRALTVRSDAPLGLTPDLFQRLLALRRLTLTNVTLSPSTLSTLPASLEALSVSAGGVLDVPESSLRRLPRLQTLLLQGGLRALGPLSAAPLLTHVTVEAPLPALPALGTVRTAVFRKAAGVSLSGGCGALQTLSVRGARVESLPARWLQPCAALTSLEVRAMPVLHEVGEHALLAGGELRALVLADCPRLRSLPPGALTGLHALRNLDLSGNSLDHLSPELFATLESLRELDLSGNHLSMSAPGTGAALRELPATLHTLRLSRNPLGDLCRPSSRDGSGVLVPSSLSVLWQLRALRSLHLSNTSAGALCPDWGAAHNLTELDLSYNTIASLECSQLEWGRAADVRLEHNPLRALALSEREYRARVSGVAGAGEGRVTVHVSALRCDCRVYWLRRALDAGVLRLRVAGARCEGGTALMEASLEDMVCVVGTDCPARCACAWSPGARTVRVSCSGRRTLPALDALSAATPGATLTLHLRHCSVRELPVALLPAALQLVDLRDNNVTSPSARELHALFAEAGRAVMLSGNPLRCSCEGRSSGDVMRALRRYGLTGQLRDYGNLSCVEGGMLAERDPDACSTGDGAGGPWGAAGALLCAACGVAMYAWRGVRWRAALKRRLRRAGRARGVGARRHEYDAFLSFSHHDCVVADRVLRELEGGGLRLCVHWRDWRAGAWIPAEIGRSVRASRRTLVLLSERFARSPWARAELREAHGRQLREREAHLVVVLLQPAPPPLDDELRRIVRAATVLRYEDTSFWCELRRVLPAPRARAPSPPPDPGTPVVKFSQMQLPLADKACVPQTSPCA